ncbi:Cytochrome P450 monooxygenase orf5 [Cladobotryum mycophilum]|uniref:Cytochrome P450 monooxygenase orf5 n=1 Tax=Cladobotryum mycophilum TaxID=491253 RepID=A0ABR0SHS4_9HYPO
MAPHLFYGIVERASLGEQCLVGVTIGVLAHLLYFIHGHKVIQTPRIVAAHLLSSWAILALFISSLGPLRGALAAASVSSCYLLGLFTSMSIYRVFFHRLSRFPGPFAAKVTKLYGPWIARNKDMHIQHQKLHEKYGDIVRIGPNELLILSLDAQQKVHGAHSKCSKRRTMYEVIHYNGALNLDSIMDRDEHRWRRQVWDKAIGTRSLETYEVYAREVMHEWLDKLQSLQGKPINTSLYSTLIPFENMGRMGFSTKFDSIAAGKEDPMLHLIEVMFASLGQLGQMTWPVVLLTALGANADYVSFERLACNLTDERAKKGDDTHEDIMKYFLEDLHSEKPRAFHTDDILYSDAQAIMVGGTDTIASALSFIFYYLARDSEVRQKLREELTPLLGKTKPGEFSNIDLGETRAPYLNSLINETMRMHNPSCSNGMRYTPPEGIEVDGVHIPGNVAMVLPIYAMQRSDRYFREANEFIPERWTTRPDLIIDKRAYHPFLLGPFNCVGRRLALIVMRFALAYTVLNYDFEFAPGEDGTALHLQAANQLILKAGPLKCVFHKRE